MGGERVQLPARADGAAPTTPIATTITSTATSTTCRLVVVRGAAERQHEDGQQMSAAYSVLARVPPPVKLVM